VVRHSWVQERTPTVGASASLKLIGYWRGPTAPNGLAHYLLSTTSACRRLSSAMFWLESIVLKSWSVKLSVALSTWGRLAEGATC
jgi:uncharacterized membrane protein